MKPKSIRAAIQMMLPEVEEMLSLGVSREDVCKSVSDRFGMEIQLRSFDTSLYRARQANKKSGLHNPQSGEPKGRVEIGLHNPIQKTERDAVPVEDAGLHNPESKKLVDDMGGNKQHLSDSDFKNIGDEAKKVASSFKSSVGNKKDF
ncbi:TPA: StbA [Klebsiella pneumoniae]|nr:StbA [Klebsiella pneumoniae]